MVNIRVMDNQKSSGSPRGEVGEIDTRAPFQSVKAAVSLFGEVAISKDKPAAAAASRKSRLSSEHVLDKETQLLLAQREVEKYKKKLDSAETAKAKVQAELQKAKRTLEELTRKLKTVSQSKQSVIEAAEAVKKQAEQFQVTKSQKQLGDASEKQELKQAREQYALSAKELDAAKQELNKIRQDFDAALEAKWAAFQQAAEFRRAANMSAEKVNEMLKEIKAMKESEEQLKIASAQAQQKQTSINAERDAHIEACRVAKVEVDKKLESMGKAYDLEMTKNLEARLAEITAEIEVLQEEMKRAHESEMEEVKFVTNELNEASKSLREVSEEETSLRNLVSFLKLELENVKREQAEIMEREALRERLAEEKKLAEQCAMLERLLSEAKSATLESEEMKKTAEEFNQESQNARSMAKQAEGKLEFALKEAEEAKAAEKTALNQMQILSGKECDENHDSLKSRSNVIKLSLKDFEALKRKAEEWQTMMETKEAEAKSELEAISARKAEAEKKLEANLKAVEEIKEATDIALRSAEMAEAAQNVVEGELRKWRQDKDTTEA